MSSRGGFGWVVGYRWLPGGYGWLLVVAGGAVASVVPLLVWVGVVFDVVVVDGFLVLPLFGGITSQN